MNEWQPIETAPRDGSRVLVWSKHYIWNGVYTAYWGRNGELNPFSWIGGHCRVSHIDHPTHWMPLPEPPSLEPSQEQEG